jgi:8-oxo-dGTP pyrophosphatase MutT (NUDIX family)
MENTAPDIVFEAQSKMGGEKIKLEWYDLIGKKIPELSWKQVHIIANYNGKVVLGYFENIKLYNLPGGHTEAGEDIQTTIQRELAEETGGTIIDWEPVGYQVKTDSKSNVSNQLRVYARVSGIKEKNIDYDGSIVPIKLVEVREMLETLGWENPIGHRIFDLVKDKFR